VSGAEFDFERGADTNTAPEREAEPEREPEPEPEHRLTPSPRRPPISLETPIPDGIAPLVALVARGTFSIEEVRELLELQRAHEHEHARLAYHAAMPRARAAMSPAIRGNFNSHFGTHYASLDALIEAAREPLAEHGFNYSFSVDITERLARITCRATHAGGHSEAVTIPVPILPGLVSNEGKSVVNPLQAIGVTITYGKRYAFSALFGLATEDSDGRLETFDAAHGAERPDPEPEPEPEPEMNDEQARELVALLGRLDQHDAGTRQRFVSHYAAHCPTADNALGLGMTVARFEKAREKAERRLAELKARAEPGGAAAAADAAEYRRESGR